MKVCSVTTCNRRVLAMGLCGAHYQRSRLGRPMDTPIGKYTYFRPATCTVPGCNAIHRGLNYCRKHYARFARHGDPLMVVHQDVPPTPHDQITYDGWHRNMLPMPTIDLSVQRRYAAQNERDGYLTDPSYIAAVRDWRGDTAMAAD